MTLHELYAGWAVSENERHYLRWELLACDEVIGVFPTTRPDMLAVLFDGDRLAFHAWAAHLTDQTGVLQ